VTDKLKEHRVIGIRHALKQFKEAGLVEDECFYPSEAVENVQDEMLGIAQTWYEIGAKRGAVEILNAILDEKFKVRKDAKGNMEIVAEVNNISWSKRLKVTIGNERRYVKKQKYTLTLKDLEFDV
jgi:hypothetical protein